MAPVYAQSNIGARYGGLQTQPGGGAGGGALSSLWDSQPAQQQQDPASSRQGRGVRLGAAAGGPRQNPFQRQAPAQEPQIQPRPLPSARAGSYQQSGGYGRGDAQTPPGSSQGISAKDRLKGNFNRGRTGSPASSVSEPPPAQRGNSYGSSGGGYTNNYEDRFMPSGNGYGGGSSSGGSDRPFVAATAPWATNESEFSGSAYGGGGGRPRPTGLPSGPAAGRRR